MKKIFLSLSLLFISGISFSQDAAVDSMDVTIYVEFDVKKNGKIANVKATKTECAECSEELKRAMEEEAVKAIEGMPAIDPKPSEKTHMVVPIAFKMPKNIEE